MWAISSLLSESFHAKRAIMPEPMVVNCRVRNDGSIFRVNVVTTDSVNKIIWDLSRRLGVEKRLLQIYYDDNFIAGNQNIAALGIIPGDVLEVENDAC